MQYQTSLSLIGTGELQQSNLPALPTDLTTSVKQYPSLHLEITLSLLDLGLMRQEGGLDTSMGRSNTIKAHRLHIRNGAEKQQSLQETFNILLNHSIKIQ